MVTGLGEGEKTEGHSTEGFAGMPLNLIMLHYVYEMGFPFTHFPPFLPCPYHLSPGLLIKLPSMCLFSCHILQNFHFLQNSVYFISIVLPITYM